MKKVYILLGHNEYTSEVINVFYSKDEALKQKQYYCLNFINIELIEKELDNIKYNTIYIVLGFDQYTAFIVQIDTSLKKINKNINKFEEEYLAFSISKKEII